MQRGRRPSEVGSGGHDKLDKRYALVFEQEREERNGAEQRATPSAMEFVRPYLYFTVSV